jgi:hypothetical protein
MRKSWIVIELVDRRRIKYANKNPLGGKGVPYNYYTYGLTPADSFSIQGDTCGKLLFDYNYLQASWKRAAADNTELFLIFPERPDTILPGVAPSGDSLLIRPDYSITQEFAFTLHSKPFWGDTGITRRPALTYQKIGIHAIQNISIIDQPFVGDTWKHY